MKKNWRRIIAAGLCVSMLGMTACGKETEKSEANMQNDYGIVSVKRSVDYGEKHKARSYTAFYVEFHNLHSPNNLLMKFVFSKYIIKLRKNIVNKYNSTKDY